MLVWEVILCFFQFWVIILLADILGYKYLSFSILNINISCHPLQACKISIQKSADSLKEVPFYGFCVFFAAFRILSWFLTPAILIILHLSVILFWFILFSNLCGFCAWMCFLLLVWEVFIHEFHQIHFAIFSFLCPSETPITWMLICLMLP